MAKKERLRMLLRRSSALIGAVLILVSCFVPAFAVAQPDPDSGKFSEIYPVVPFDTFVFDPQGLNISFPFPQQTVYVQPGLNTGVTYDSDIYVLDPDSASGYSQEHISLRFAHGGYQSISGYSSFYSVGLNYVAPYSPNLIDFALVSQQFPGNIDLLDLLSDWMYVTVPSGYRCNAIVTIKSKILSGNSNVSFTSYSDTQRLIISNDTNAGKDFYFFPTADSFKNLWNAVLPNSAGDGSEGFTPFFVEELSIRLRFSALADDVSVVPNIFICLPYTTAAVNDFTAWALQNLHYEVTYTEFPSDWVGWLGRAADAFFGIEIAPGFSLGLILAVCVGMLVFFAILKFLR